MSGLESKLVEKYVQRVFGGNLVEMVGTLTTSSSTNAILELIVNAYDADATEVKVDYDPFKRTLKISDNGSGMNEEEFAGFYRLGDSIKLKETFSPKGRKRIGKFGVATIVLKILAGKYSLSTTKDDMQISLSESFDGQLKNDKKIPYKVSKKQNSLSGTHLELNDIKFREGDGFSIKELKRKVQWELPLLPDFKVYVNGEEVSPRAIKEATAFNFDTNGIAMGRIDATIYYTNSKTPMRGIHVYVNGRQVGDPENIVNLAGMKMSLVDRIVGIIHADVLEPAILFDRGRFNEDDPAYVELRSYLKNCIRKIVTHIDATGRSTKVSRLESERKNLIKAASARLAYSGLEEITRSTVFEPNDSIQSGVLATYNPENNSVLFNLSHPSLLITDQTTPALFTANIIHATIDAIVLHRLNCSGKQTLERYLLEKNKVWEAINQGVKSTNEKEGIHPRILYTVPKLAEITGLHLGEVRYMVNGGLFLMRGSDDLIAGKSVLDSQRKIRGKVSLYAFAYNNEAGHNSVDNMPLYMDRYTLLLMDAGKSISPMVVNFGTHHEPCFFIDETCIKVVSELFKSKLMDRRNPKFNPSKVFNDASNAYYSLPVLSEKLGFNGSQKAGELVEYAKRHKLNLRHMTHSDSTYNFGDAVMVLQHMREL